VRGAFPDSVEEGFNGAGRGKFIRQWTELFGGCTRPPKQCDWLGACEVLQFDHPQPCCVDTKQSKTAAFCCEKLQFFDDQKQLRAPWHPSFWYSTVCTTVHALVL